MASIDAYRNRARRYFILVFPLLFLCLITPPAMLFLFEQLHLITKEQGAPICLIFWVFWSLALIYFKNWYSRRAAERCGMICTNCSKIATPSDIRLIAASHNCPYCGKPFYQ